MVVGASWAGLRAFYKLLISWDFHSEQSLEFTQNNAKKNKFEEKKKNILCVESLQVETPC